VTDDTEECVALDPDSRRYVRVRLHVLCRFKILVNCECYTCARRLPEFSVIVTRAGVYIKKSGSQASYREFDSDSAITCTIREQ
jgi:hypothetical protein